MQPLMTTRRMILGCALAFSAIAAAWVDAEGSDATEAVEVVPATRAVRPAGKTTAEPVQQEALMDIRAKGSHRHDARQEVRELFAVKSWYVAPPPPQPAPPPPPSAPPLPFVYLGKMVNEGKTTVFLTKQDRNYAIKEGDVVDGTYRIDSIKGSTIDLVYIPLDTKQTMAIGEQN